VYYGYNPKLKIIVQLVLVLVLLKLSDGAQTAVSLNKRMKKNSPGTSQAVAGLEALHQVKNSLPGNLKTLKKSTNFKNC
jgi:hypothetical protein